MANEREQRERVLRRVAAGGMPCYGRWEEGKGISGD